MSILSDGEILSAIDAGDIGVKPFDASLIQPASLDFRLGLDFKIPNMQGQPFIDPKLDQLNEWTAILLGNNDSFTLQPGQFVLATSAEYFTIGSTLVAQIDGKSSLGRCGLVVHATAGYIDPGFEGQVTLELSNVAPLPIKLYPGMAIAQMHFVRLGAIVRSLYAGKYNQQRGATVSRYHLNYEEAVSG